MKVADRKLPWVATAVHVGNTLHEDGTMNHDIKVKRACNRRERKEQIFCELFRNESYLISLTYGTNYHSSWLV